MFIRNALSTFPLVVCISSYKKIHNILHHRSVHINTLKTPSLSETIDPSPKWQPKIQIRWNELKLKTNTTTRKGTLTLVTLSSVIISGEISAEKMYVKN